jgi:hypothetical protein
MYRAGSASEISEATDRLSAAVTALDLGEILPSTAKELVAVGEQIERLGHGLKTAAAAKVAASQVWRGDGDRTPEEWLARRTGTSRSKARQALDTARRLEDLPATADAVRRGELSAEQAAAIADAASADPTAERTLLDSVGDGDLRSLQDRCARTKANADPDPDATARRIHRRRSYRTWTDPEGVGHLHLSGPASAIARVDNAVRHRAEKLFHTARREGRREPAEAYCFDATEVLTTTGGDRSPVPAGADAKIIVRVDHTALLRGHPVDGEICEIAGIGPIPVSVVHAWMPDAFVAALFTRGDVVSKVVHLGRRFTATQRTTLQWHDPVCANRACSNRLRLEYDHLEDWAATRTTRTEAAKRFCPPCHRLKTLGWHVTDPGPDGQCDFTEPDTTHPADLATTARQAVTTQTLRRRRRTQPRSDPDPPHLFDTS